MWEMKDKIQARKFDEAQILLNVLEKYVKKDIFIFIMRSKDHALRKFGVKSSFGKNRSCFWVINSERKVILISKLELCSVLNWNLETKNF
jgi:hypothetical protein